MAESIMAHIDMDAFYASIEEREHPEYRGKPLAVRLDLKRSPVASANYEAKKWGVRGGMSTYEARLICPEIAIITGDLGKYIDASLEFFELCRSYTDEVERYGVDEVWMDLTGIVDSLDDAREFAKEIKRGIRNELGLTASVGISYNKLLSKMASDMEKPDGLVVLRKGDIKRIYPLDVRKLFGVGAKTEIVLKDEGIETIEDMARAPLDYFVALFKKSRGTELYLKSRGIDYSPVVPYYASPPPKSMGRRCTLGSDISDRGTMECVLFTLSAWIARELQDMGYSSRSLTVNVTWSNFERTTRSKTVQEPFNDRETVFSQAKRLLPNSQKKVRTLGISASKLIRGEPVQMMLFE